MSTLVGSVALDNRIRRGERLNLSDGTFLHIQPQLNRVAFMEPHAVVNHMMSHALSNTVRHVCLTIPALLLTCYATLWPAERSALAQAPTPSPQTPTSTPTPTVTHDQGAWVGLYTHYLLTDQLGFYGEYHLRRSGGLDRMSKLTTRLGVSYHPSPTLSLKGGTEHRLSWSKRPNDPTEEPYVSEHRAWEQLSTSLTLFGLKLGQQVRLEQRWRRSTSKLKPDYDVVYRHRYKLSLCRGLPGADSLFACAYNEVFLQTGEAVERRYFEENRSYLGLGAWLSPQLSVQIGYMRSYGQTGDERFKSDDIIRLNLYHRLSFVERGEEG